MKHIKTYMGICLGSLLMTMSSCEPDMDFNNPSADNEATYYNTKEHLTYAVNGAQHSSKSWRMGSMDAIYAECT